MMALLLIPILQKMTMKKGYKTSLRSPRGMHKSTQTMKNLFGGQTKLTRAEFEFDIKCIREKEDSIRNTLI